MILSRLHGIRATRAASFKVLVSLPSPDSASRAIGHYSYLSKTPTGIGVHVEAFVVRSSATSLSAQGMWCRSRTSKSFSSFWHGAGRQRTGIIAAALPLNLLDDQLGVTLY
jgi:hypothetical protein